MSRSWSQARRSRHGRRLAVSVHEGVVVVSALWLAKTSCQSRREQPEAFLYERRRYRTTTTATEADQEGVAEMASLEALGPLALLLGAARLPHCARHTCIA